MARNCQVVERVAGDILCKGCHDEAEAETRADEKNLLAQRPSLRYEHRHETMFFLQLRALKFG